MSPDSAIRFLWLIFIGYWALSAAGVKKDVHREYRGGRFTIVRVLILILVRHPIYTGILLALLGNTFVFGARWLIFVLAFVVIVARRVQAEERLMMQQFPEQYPEYRKRTKAVIPFVV